MSTTIRNKVEVKGGFVSGNMPGFQNTASHVAGYTETTILDYSFIGGVLASNGKIYFVSNTGSSYVIVVNPMTGEIERLASGSWVGRDIVSAPDGMLYGLPLNGTTIMSINPETHEVNVSHKTGVSSGGDDYNGAVLHPNGNIYLVPRNANNVGVYNYAANTFSATTPGLTGLVSSGWKWGGGCLAPNGKIYCGPNSFRNSVLIIDPYTPSLDQTTIAGMSTWVRYGWSYGCLAPNGKIYFAPHAATTALIVDPSNDTADETTITGVTGSYYGGVLAPNGKIYCLPSNATTNVLVIDPSDDSIDIATYTGLPATINKFVATGILAPNGKIYAAGYDSAYKKVLELTPGGIPMLPIEPLLSPYKTHG